MRLSLIAALVLLGGCASTTEIRTRHSDQAEAGTEPARHILLAARTPEKAKRIQWEKECADTLKRSGLRITRAHQVLPDWQEPGADALEEWSRDHDADAVLLADITGLLLDRPDFPEEDPATGEPEIQAQWTFYPGSKAPEKAEEKSVYEEIRLEWITPDGRRPWAGMARTHEAHELGAVARSQCQALGKTLTERGLLPARD
jgi:hypothetical protein